MACPDNCCTLRVSDIRPTDAEPVCIDANEWLESVGATQLGSATWTVIQKDCEQVSLPTEVPSGEGSATDLLIENQEIDKGQNTASATITGGIEGEMYNINVTLESCEGYKKTICFQQYISKCR